MEKEYEKFSSYALINLDNLEHNLKSIQKNLGKSKILGVVKADAYNHGAEMVAEKMYRCGIRHFAVANIDEAITLRKCGIGGMMLVLGPMLPSRYSDAVKNDISVTIDSSESLDFLKSYIYNCKNPEPIKVHIALNTGMNRIGFKVSEYCLSDELCDAAEIIKCNPYIVPEGIFSHFCDADNSDVSFTQLQFNRFEKTVSLLSEKGIEFSYKHICNSAGTIKYSQYHCDLVRFGIGLYGCEFPGSDLLPVMSFKTHIAQILNVKKGEKIGYGLTYTAERDMRVATVAAGYADGFNRLLSNKGCVIIKGKRAPVVGRICMDMTMTDVTDIPEATLFDEATIIGSDGNETVTAEELAEICGTISYEILCLIGKRAHRIYIENGKILVTDTQK